MNAKHIWNEIKRADKRIYKLNELALYAPNAEVKRAYQAKIHTLRVKIMCLCEKPKA